MFVLRVWILERIVQDWTSLLLLHIIWIDIFTVKICLARTLFADLTLLISHFFSLIVAIDLFWSIFKVIEDLWRSRLIILFKFIKFSWILALIIVRSALSWHGSCFYIRILILLLFERIITSSSIFSKFFNIWRQSRPRLLQLSIVWRKFLAIANIIIFNNFLSIFWQKLSISVLIFIGAVISQFLILLFVNQISKICSFWIIWVTVLFIVIMVKILIIYLIIVDFGLADVALDLLFETFCFIQHFFV